MSLDGERHFAGEVGSRMEEILPDFYVDGRSQCECGKDVCAEYPKRQREKVVLFSAVREKITKR
mgnify:CR=1 FL=1